MSADMRGAFEHWVKETGYSTDWSREGGGFQPESEYLKPRVRDAWQCWQAAVASTNAERIAWWMMQRGYATGHGDTVEDMLTELEAQAHERGAKIGVAESASVNTKTGESNGR